MAMSDREILEALANHMGFAKCDGVHPIHGLMWFTHQIGTDREYCWNPLNNNGDAFRVMVAFDLSSIMIYGDGDDKRREFWTPNSGHDDGRSATRGLEADPLAATRRAVVEAAVRSIGCILE